jgi:hypothetical protein
MFGQTAFPASFPRVLGPAAGTLEVPAPGFSLIVASTFQAACGISNAYHTIVAAS